MFVYPESRIKISAKRNVVGDRRAMTVDLDKLVLSILDGAKKFMADMSGKEPFESNLKKCVSLHEKGIPPWIQGIPVVG